MKTRHMCVSRNHTAKISKLFLYDCDHYDMVKCHQNVNFEEIGTEPSTGKNDEEI